MTNAPDLLFGKTNTWTGFTPAGIAAYDDLKPAPVIRELIQNSLDAARLAKVWPAIVKFKVTSANRNEIPGLMKFEETFRMAVDSHTKTANSKANLEIERIKYALGCDKLNVLSILDNGVGLNETRMTALLSDGVSAKGNDATGTYGNGHVTAIPSSDMRYVLYGGLTKDGSRICSGHAVLATHVIDGKDHFGSGDGYYITGFKGGTESFYGYSTDCNLPDMVSKELDEIESAFGHGTAVIVPAFNNLKEEDSLWDMVSQVAAANFFAAIEDGDLVVGVEIACDGSENYSWELDGSNLESELIRHKDKRDGGGFLSSGLALDAYRAYVSGKSEMVEVSSGTIDVRIRENASGNTRAHLCRNGMWVTDKIPSFRNRFADRVPFQVILSVNATLGEKFHDLIRNAEGPLHNSIVLKRLPDEQRTLCRQELRSIVQWIWENTNEIKSDPYVPDDYLVIDSDGELSNGTRGRNLGFRGTPTLVRRSPVRQLRGVIGSEEESGVVPENPKKNRGNEFPPNQVRKRKRPTLPTFFRAVSRPLGTNRRIIIIECERDFSNAEMRLVVDEALDATCDRLAQDPYIPARLANVHVNGNLVECDKMIYEDNDVAGVLLGDLSAGTEIIVETDYEFDGDFVDLPNLSLRVEISRRQAENDGKDVTNQGSGPLT